MSPSAGGSANGGRRPPARPAAPSAKAKPASARATRTPPPRPRPPAGRAVSPPRSPRPRRRRRSHGRLLGALLASVVLVGFLLVAVFPTRTYLQQRAATRSAAQQLQVLHAKNAALHTQIKRLQTREEIEREARKEYGMVRKGEEAYAILPSPPPPVQLPDVWPFTGVAALLNR